MTEAHQLQVNGQAIEAVHSARAKRLQLRVDGRRGVVKLVIPRGMSLKKALAFAEDRSAWIAQQVDRIPQPTAFHDGMILPFKGHNHRVEHRPTGRLVRCLGDTIQVPGGKEHFERRLLDWLKTQAKEDITGRAMEKAARINKTINRVSIRDTVSRWGSCSSNGNLSFSWRLILTPDSIRDYLAAHEVAHLQEMNHSPRFWAVCESLTDLATVKDCERYLKDHARRLFAYAPTKR